MNPDGEIVKPLGGGTKSIGGKTTDELERILSSHRIPSAEIIQCASFACF